MSDPTFVFPVHSANRMTRSAFLDYFESPRVKTVTFSDSICPWLRFLDNCYSASRRWYSPLFFYMKPLVDRQLRNMVDATVNNPGTTYVLIINVVLCFIPIGTLKKLRATDGVRIKLILFDSVSWCKRHVLNFMNKLNLIGAENVYTFDENDALKYGFKRTLSYYSKHPSEEKEIDGVFFIGSDKGRYGKLAEISEYLTARGVECDFRVLGVRSAPPPRTERNPPDKKGIAV